MRKTISLIAALLLVAIVAIPASAQVGLEEGTILSPRRHGFGAIVVFTSAVDTINATANDTTGTMPVAMYTATAPIIVYTVASGGTVSLDLLSQVAPTPTGPWYTVAHDTISATGSAAVSVSESTSYKMPFYRILVDGIGANDAATIFTYLYVVRVLDDRFTISWQYWKP